MMANCFRVRKKYSYDVSDGHYEKHEGIGRYSNSDTSINQNARKESKPHAVSHRVHGISWPPRDNDISDEYDIAETLPIRSSGSRSTVLHNVLDSPESGGQIDNTTCRVQTSTPASLRYVWPQNVAELEQLSRSNSDPPLTNIRLRTNEQSTETRSVPRETAETSSGVDQQVNGVAAHPRDRFSFSKYGGDLEEAMTDSPTGTWDSRLNNEVVASYAPTDRFKSTITVDETAMHMY